MFLESSKNKVRRKRMLRVFKCWQERISLLMLALIIDERYEAVSIAMTTVDLIILRAE